ncbi:hypothetical protein A4L_04 [Anabaena phage A-4L]|uniref:Uncharacterized protein n=1 Tax=Anabaena phage A-4L TaxID=1357732 RepID=A0A059PY37_9CAUD|nr:hypothetical protein A4L_04 [Anabaena phage A-4L]AGR48531.1 hypothetical protein A4L_04 [Anabaena phage A-4L]
MLTNTVPFAIQILSRTNDREGNPYRLVVIYNSDMNTIQVVSFRSGRYMDFVYSMSDCRRLPEYHLSPSEYNKVAREYIERQLLTNKV